MRIAKSTVSGIPSLLLSLVFIAVGQATPIDPAIIKKGDTGPVTAFGETQAEQLSKKVMFDWVYLMMVDRKPQEAFAKYVSKNYCDHGHLAAGMNRDCASYEETLKSFMRYARPLKSNEKVEIPTMAAVNGEMVTMFGDGIDIFRVHSGKITDHWDASPPAAWNTAGPPPPGQRPARPPE